MVDPHEIDEVIFTPEEEALLLRVRQSQLWRVMEEAMRWERETLLTKKTATRDEVLLAWGGVQVLTRWLNSGPTLVVYSDRLRHEESKTHE